jgi:hypothetical protein
MNVFEDYKIGSDRLDLVRFGYAPGNYMSRCWSCGDNLWNVDKRCHTCEPCAIESADAYHAMDDFL